MFEKKIKPILQYIGTIGAVITSIVYVIAVFIIIFGFKAESPVLAFIFALINALIGLIIMQFLKVQGVSFAKNIPENLKIAQEYYKTKTRDKKLHSLNYYIYTSLIKDVIFKGISIILTTTGLIYIVIQGCYDYSLLLLAAANLLMFICFGLLALNSAYEFYNNYHIPYMVEQIKFAKKMIKKGDINKCLQSMINNLETLKNKS